MSKNVLLLRSPSEDGDGLDKYEEAFRARGYRPVSVPVLETVHENLDKLAEVVKRGGATESEDTRARYAGVIVTSARACEAWRVVIQGLSEDIAHSSDGIAPFWSTIPFYVVGAATASTLTSIASSFPTSPYVPHDIRGGAESGTAEKLARFIITDLPESGSKQLLYLTGDKNRDTLPKILDEAGLKLESLQVYATQGSSRFEDDLSMALENSSQATEKWWIVHFAPSAAKTVSLTLNKYFEIPAAGKTQSISRRRASIAAIGPTTSTFLQDELHVDVAVVAEKPTPEALSKGISAWDQLEETNPVVGGL
ncbi:tetrapyrrole biosynthesis uroporphyrinogen III synthase [Trametes gibbosa]|nr:tetrapyrrole biosynthesis uroporphyrinogen III synthase [Trametes gibbosa]